MCHTSLRINAGSESWVLRGAGLTGVNQSAGEQLAQAPGVGVGGPDHGQVAVQADEGQDENAAVQVDRVDHVHAHARHRAQPPVGQRRVHRPEGQREDEEEVRRREVQTVAVRQTAFGPGDGETDGKIITCLERRAYFGSFKTGSSLRLTWLNKGSINRILDTETLSR